MHALRRTAPGLGISMTFALRPEVEILQLAGVAGSFIEPRN